MHLICSTCDTGAPVDPLYGTCLMCHLRALEELRAADDAADGDTAPGPDA